MQSPLPVPRKIKTKRNLRRIISVKRHEIDILGGMHNKDVIVRVKRFCSGFSSHLKLRLRCVHNVCCVPTCGDGVLGTVPVELPQRDKFINLSFKSILINRRKKNNKNEPNNTLPIPLWFFIL